MNKEFMTNEDYDKYIAEYNSEVFIPNDVTDIGKHDFEIIVDGPFYDKSTVLFSEFFNIS